MIKIQKNIAYTQVLEILNYIKIEDYYKIPKELICALESNKDKDVKFKYNQEKDFLDQNVSQEAKLILAIFFKIGNLTPKTFSILGKSDDENF